MIFDKMKKVTPKTGVMSYHRRSLWMIFFQHFIRLANILSSFPAVYEIIHGEPLPAKETYSLRDIPDSIMVTFNSLKLMLIVNPLNMTLMANLVFYTWFMAKIMNRHTETMLCSCNFWHRMYGEGNIYLY